MKAETPKEVEKKPEVVKEATPAAPKPNVIAEPKVEVPKVEASKAPAVEATNAEEKAKEAPKVVIAAPQKVEVKTEAPKVQEKKVVEEKPKNEKPAVKAPVETPVKEEKKLILLMKLLVLKQND